MLRLALISLLCISSSFHVMQTGNYMFVALIPIPHCDGKCNNFEIKEFPKKNAEDCKKQEDSCIAKYGTKATYYTVAPGEAVVYYKYNKFVTNCDCKILGVYKSTSVETAKAEMNKKVADEQAIKPKAYHNYEIYSWWPR